ncbi:NADH-quinone oxidoreductase subunit J [Polynucleobacter rarus]|jgi:NADH-quinone oxidoreductase subunit J|uniref:NADH-quinone oxidoreductase subunit J n=1 Tax=Polynucleobacter rarus TaxID=556055 RepID=UPI000D3E9E7A|nr:NADH-quinone oxidoreductase subunit J [Polynucleobacter rarus]
MNFDSQTILFYIFALVLLVSGFKVISTKNPVHAALFLVLAFFNAAGIWMLLQAEFLSIALILVYVGAVMVLFLFVVMMLDLDVEHLRNQFKQFLPVATIVGFVIVVEMTVVLVRGFIGSRIPMPLQTPEGESNTMSLGKLIYGDYVFAFEIAGIILLVAIVAAVALTLRRRKDHKSQDVPAQIRTKKEDRVRIVSMPADIANRQDGKK